MNMYAGLLINGKMAFEGKKRAKEVGLYSFSVYTVVDIHHIRNLWLNIFKSRKNLVFVSPLGDKNSKKNLKVH